MALAETEKSIILAHARELLYKRSYPKTICPSEIARALSGDELDTLNVPDWRSVMDRVRRVVWELRENGEVEVLQKGEVIDVQTLEDVKGPIRVRIKR